MDKLKQIHDRIKSLRVEEYYEPNDLIQILNIIGELVDELIRIESESIPPNNET